MIPTDIPMEFFPTHHCVYTLVEFVTSEKKMCVEVKVTQYTLKVKVTISP